MLRYSKKVYIENGTSIRPDWTDRIAFSWFPDKGYTMPAAGVTYSTAAVVTGTDIVPGNYTLTGVSFCRNYWEFHDPDGTYSINNAFCTNFYTPQAGDFRYYIHKAAGETNESNFYLGRHGDLVYGTSSNGVDFAARNESNMSVTLNDGALVTYDGTGYVQYAKNVFVTDAESVEAIALNEEITGLFDAVNNPPLYLAENRVYVEELGCYFGGGLDISPTWTLNEDLKCDWSIKKSEILRVEKLKLYGGMIGNVPVPDKFAVVIVLTDGTETVIEMGQVANKSTWVATAAGVDIAHNEIMGWL
jgi:hypothetical protein